ncbi:MAG: hypothetical protein Q4A39_06170 [Eubacteriales bacterium]|nr:hypothetical protein [Eubacteriales bacterium]
MMTIQELGLSYLENSRICRARWHELHERLKNEELRECDRLLLRRRLTILQAMADETHAIGQYLRDYYHDEELAHETTDP